MVQENEQKFALVLNVDDMDVDYHPVGTLFDLGNYYLTAIAQADTDKEQREIESSMKLYKVTSELPEASTASEKTLGKVAATALYTLSLVRNAANRVVSNPKKIKGALTKKFNDAAKSVQKNLKAPGRLLMKAAGDRKISLAVTIGLAARFNTILGAAALAHTIFTHKDDIAETAKDAYGVSKDAADGYVKNAQRSSNISMPDAISTKDGNFIGGNWLAEKDNARALPTLSQLKKYIEKVSKEQDSDLDSPQPQ